MRRVVLFPPAAAALLKAHVDQYTRADGTVVQAHDDKRQAAQPAPPPLGAHAAALASSSKDGDMDHWHNQIAADDMRSGNAKNLSASLRSMDTAARDHVLDHIHPSHWTSLGFEPIDERRALAKYHAKFGAPQAAAKPSPAPAAKKPKDFAAGANVYFPHPEKAGKQALGKFVGKSGDKSIVEHPQFGKLAFDHGHVKAARGVPGGSKTTAPAKPAAADITKHPQYHPADHEYLNGKGWSDDEIRERWDAEQKAGLPPMSVNKHKPPSWTENASPTGSGVKPGPAPAQKPAKASPLGNAESVSHKASGKMGVIVSTSGDRHDVKWSTGEKSSHHHSELSKVDDR